MTSFGRCCRPGQARHTQHRSPVIRTLSHQWFLDILHKPTIFMTDLKKHLLVRVVNGPFVNIIVDLRIRSCSVGSLKYSSQGSQKFPCKENLFGQFMAKPPRILTGRTCRGTVGFSGIIKGLFTCRPNCTGQFAILKRVRARRIHKEIFGIVRSCICSQMISCLHLINGCTEECIVLEIWIHVPGNSS